MCYFMSWNLTQSTAPISTSLSLIFLSEVFRAANPHHPALGAAYVNQPFASVLTTWVTKLSPGALNFLD